MKSLAWSVLLLAGVLEIVWAVGVKYTRDWTRPGPSAVVIAAYVLCLPLLAWAMKHLPAATAYAAWVGIGTAGVTVWGILFLGESASIPRLFCIALIAAGVVGLKLVN